MAPTGTATSRASRIDDVHRCRRSARAHSHAGAHPRSLRPQCRRRRRDRRPASVARSRSPPRRRSSRRPTDGGDEQREAGDDDHAEVVGDEPPHRPGRRSRRAARRRRAPVAAVSTACHVRAAAARRGPSPRARAIARSRSRRRSEVNRACSRPADGEEAEEAGEQSRGSGRPGSRRVTLAGGSTTTNPASSSADRAASSPADAKMSAARLHSSSVDVGAQQRAQRLRLDDEGVRRVGRVPRHGDPADREHAPASRHRSPRS